MPPRATPSAPGPLSPNPACTPPLWRLDSAQGPTSIPRLVTVFLLSPQQTHTGTLPAPLCTRGGGQVEGEVHPNACRPASFCLQCPTKLRPPWCPVSPPCLPLSSPSPGAQSCSPCSHSPCLLLLAPVPSVPAQQRGRKQPRLMANRSVWFCFPSVNNTSVQGPTSPPAPSTQTRLHPCTEHPPCLHPPTSL